MALVHYDYDIPAPSSAQMSGLVVDSYMGFDITGQTVSGTFTPMMVNPDDPLGPRIPVPGSKQEYTIPLTLADISTIMRVIFDRAAALGMTPIPGTLIIE